MPTDFVSRHGELTTTFGDIFKRQNAERLERYLSLLRVEKIEHETAAGFEPLTDDDYMLRIILGAAT